MFQSNHLFQLFVCIFLEGASGKVMGHVKFLSAPSRRYFRAKSERMFYMTPGLLLPRREFNPVPSRGSLFVYMIPQAAQT